MPDHRPLVFANICFYVSLREYRLGVYGWFSVHREARRFFIFWILLFSLWLAFWEKIPAPDSGGDVVVSDISRRLPVELGSSWVHRISRRVRIDAISVSPIDCNVVDLL